MKHSISDQGDLRKIFAAIPRIVFTLGLNPYEFTLYAYLKDTARENGACWKSRATIAKESGMSSGMVTKARQALEKPRPELGGLPLITVSDEPTKGGGLPTCCVSITDIWGVGTTSPHDVATSHHDRQRHHTTLATSPHDHKEEALNKKQEEDKSAFLKKLELDPLYAHVNFDFEIEKMRRWFARPENEGRRMTEQFVIRWLNKIERPVDFAPEPSRANGNREAWEAEQRKRMGWPEFS